jgi:hypothetical protein
MVAIATIATHDCFARASPVAGSSPARSAALDAGLCGSRPQPDYRQGAQWYTEPGVVRRYVGFRDKLLGSAEPFRDWLAR